MMAVFFVGIGIASIAHGLCSVAPRRSPSPCSSSACLLPSITRSGLAMVVEGAAKSGTGMAIGINGVWGNLGVGSAALITGFLIDRRDGARLSYFRASSRS